MIKNAPIAVPRIRRAQSPCHDGAPWLPFALGGAQEAVTDQSVNLTRANGALPGRRHRSHRACRINGWHQAVRTHGMRLARQLTDVDTAEARRRRFGHDTCSTGEGPLSPACGETAHRSRAGSRHAEQGRESTRERTAPRFSRRSRSALPLGSLIEGRAGFVVSASVYRERRLAVAARPARRWPARRVAPLPRGPRAPRRRPPRAPSPSQWA